MRSHGSLSLIRSLIDDNSSRFGGGRRTCTGTVDLIESEIAHNAAGASGGGVPGVLGERRCERDPRQPCGEVWWWDRRERRRRNLRRFVHSRELSA